MPPKKKRTKKKVVTKKNVVTVKEEEIRDAHLPGYLLIAFGLLGLGINFDLFAGLTWVKAYPLLAVLFGVVALVKLAISRD
ncbi:MAG: hypothetical protein ABH983_05975 [Candidatus Micrarchaeota archaeon]